MDTDDLSQEAYEAVIIEAERFNHDLTSQFGLLSSECKNEKEYLEKSILLIHELKKIKPGEFEDILPQNDRPIRRNLTEYKSDHNRGI